MLSCALWQHRAPARPLGCGRASISIGKEGTIVSVDKILVTFGGLAAIALIVWFFWMVKRPGVKAGLSSSGYQEAMVLVKGGCTPDVIVVQRGKPVRLNFVR